MNRVPDLDARIIYQGEGLLVVNKPYNIPTSGRTLDDDDALQYWLMQRQGDKVWAVHQLDADTTGVNLFVTRKQLVATMQQALSASVKTYLAVVHGEPSWDKQVCRAAIGEVDARSLGVTEHGRTAHSEFTVLAKAAGFALLKAQIFTGRTHQIRIHLAHLGHALVGEEWYRSTPCHLHPRQALHAHSVSIYQPDQRTFVAPLAPDLQQLCQRLNLC